jgi:hypothetical protein
MMREREVSCLTIYNIVFSFIGENRKTRSFFFVAVLSQSQGRHNNLWISPKNLRGTPAKNLLSDKMTKWLIDMM